MRFSTSPRSRPPPSRVIAPPVKLCPNHTSLLGMKFKDKLVSLCAHKAVLLLGTISFWTKELCHEATAFF
jgi:hypothetical protein